MNLASPIAALMLVLSLGLLLHAAPVSARRASTGGAGRGVAAAGRGASMGTGGTESGPVTGGGHARIRRRCGARGVRCVGGGSRGVKTRPSPRFVLKSWPGAGAIRVPGQRRF